MPKPFSNTPIELVYNHRPVTGLFGVALIAVGFFLNFFGIRFFRFVIGVSGFIIFALASYILLINLHLHHVNLGGHFDLILGSGVLVGGAIGAALSQCLWYWALLGLGALGGVSLGILLLSLLAPIIPGVMVWLLPVVLGVFAIIAAYLLKRFERPLIVLATSLIGSVLFSFGTDIFAQTGFDALILSIIGAGIPDDLQIKLRQTYGMISVCIGLAILGVIIQTRVTGKKVQRYTRK